MRFPGQYFDQETNLHYNNFRYYDPTIGRYITSDPIGLKGGNNTYSYVEQNSLSLYDTFGLEVTGSWLVKPHVIDIKVYRPSSFKYQAEPQSLIAIIFPCAS